MCRNPRNGERMSPELLASKNMALDHIKTVQEQVEEVIRMLESGTYCIDVMKQIQAVQDSLERVNRATLHKHLATCFSETVVYGRGQASIDELVDAVKFTPALSAQQVHLDGHSIGQGAASRVKQALQVTSLFLPGISSQACQRAIERIVTPIAGVGTVEVDVPTKTITIRHDDRSPASRLIQALEDQGYQVDDTGILTAPEKWTGDHDRRQHRSEAHDRNPGPHTTTSTPLVAPKEQCAVASLGFIDGDGI